MGSSVRERELFLLSSDLVRKQDDRQYHQLYCEASWQLSDNGPLSEKTFPTERNEQLTGVREPRTGTLM